MSKAGSDTGLTGPRASCFQSAETYFWALKKTRGRNSIYRGVRGNEAVLFKLSIMEMGKEEIAGTDYLVLMELEPMKTQYRTLRRQLYLIQSICVLLCFTCCLFTITYHSYPSCKENGNKDAPNYGMQHQGSKEMIQTVTRLSANISASARKAHHVPWKHASESYHSGYFTLDEDGVSLTVIQDGMYKVSLQITYRGVEELNGTLILQHDILHYTDRYDINLPLPLPLLTYWETVNFTSPYWKKSLFSEGIFFLESGDKLKVWTNSMSLIDVGEKKTAFVVYPHFSALGFGERKKDISLLHKD